MEVVLRLHLRQGARSPQFGSGENRNPYEILGISPLDEFDRVKMVYKRRRNDAETSCNWEYLIKLDRAYDMVIMDQLLKRKKGVAMAYGSIQIGSPYSSYFFAYFYQILEKLKATEPAITPIYNGYGEVEGRGIHMAKRVLRSLGLMLGSILAVSVGYTGLANFSIFRTKVLHGSTNMELIMTTASSVLLCILLPIAIGAGLEKTCSINDTCPSSSNLRNFVQTDQMLLSNDWGKRNHATRD